MDPTAPNDPNQKNNPSSPIQPGQFVVAGEDAAPGVTAQAAPTTAQDPPPTPAVSLAGERSDSAPQVFPNAPVSGASTQPDPTPFVPPVPGSASQDAAVPSAGGGGKGGMKMIMIVVAILVLVAIIGAVVYFFVLPKTKSTTTSTQSTTDIQVDSPASPSPRQDGGFGQIPDSTASAQPAPADTTTTNSDSVSP